MILRSIHPLANLSLKPDAIINSQIAVVIGKNGAGKSRLLSAIGSGAIMAQEPFIHHSRILKYDMSAVRPTIELTFDPKTFNEQAALAAAYFIKSKNDFFRRLADEHDSVARQFSVPALQNAIATAVIRTKREMSQLGADDIINSYSPGFTGQLGQVNIAGLFYEYDSRIRRNRINEALNRHFGDDVPWESAEHLNDAFGPSPEAALGELLEHVFHGKFRLEVEHRVDNAPYSVSFCLSKSGERISINALSSGEAVLFWLLLATYAGQSQAWNFERPQLLLLDEPDSRLHPQMVQQLYKTIKLITDQFNCAVIMTTHSPTTAALADERSVYEISDQHLRSVDRDYAVASLLDGVPSISISRKNRRQVYVESHYDAEFYQTIDEFLRKECPGELVPEISFSFLSSGAALSLDTIRQSTSRLKGITPDVLLALETEILKSGNSSRVRGTVSSLRREGATTVYGIVDWDSSNCESDGIIVSCPSAFYSRENAILNPLTLAAFLISRFHRKLRIPGGVIRLPQLKAADQSGTTARTLVADWVATKVLPDCDHTLKDLCSFVDGFDVPLSRAYCHWNGHDLQAAILKAFPFLTAFANPSAGLMREVTDNFIIGTGNGDFLPRAIVETLQRLQGGRGGALDRS